MDEFIIIVVLATIISIIYFYCEYEKKMAHIIVTHEGLIDKIGSVNYGLIEWRDIKGFRIEESIKHRLLIDVFDDEKYISKLSVNRRFGPSYQQDLKNNRFNYGTAVFLDTAILSISTIDLLATIKQHREKLAASKDNQKQYVIQPSNKR